MLSRVAENLFWIGRYIERAENVARLIDTARRMSSLPRNTGRAESTEWSSVLIAAGAREAFGEAIDRADAGTAVDHLIFNKTNPSSVHSNLSMARENARAIRFAVTQECWEAVNTAWAEMRALSNEQTIGAGLADVIDWVKAKSANFRGAVHGTMMRGDGYDFLHLGMAIERADSTARLLDVKYHVLLPSVSDVGAGEDHYQWLSLLQAAAAQRAYFFVTKSDVSAKGVAEFLILDRMFPRSIVFNLRRASRAVGDLEVFYGQPASCRTAVTELADHVERHSVDSILAFGLHEFLTDIIDRNYEIANPLAQAYGFAPIEGESDLVDDTAGQ